MNSWHIVTFHSYKVVIVIAICPLGVSGLDSRPSSLVYFCEIVNSINFIQILGEKIDCTCWLTSIVTPVNLEVG